MTTKATKMVSFRAEAEEVDAWLACAKREGQSLSQWIVSSLRMRGPGQKENGVEEARVPDKKAEPRSPGPGRLRKAMGPACMRCRNYGLMVCEHQG